MFFLSVQGVKKKHIVQEKGAYKNGNNRINECFNCIITTWATVGRAAMAERPYSTPGPSHRAPQARTAKAVPTEARLVHEEFVSEEARQRRRLDGERKQREEHEAKVARDQAAREQAA